MELQAYGPIERAEREKKSSGNLIPALLIGFAAGSLILLTYLAIQERQRISRMSINKHAENETLTEYQSH